MATRKTLAQNKISRRKLAKHYFVDKIEQKEVAQLYDVSRSAIYRLQKKYQLEPLEIWQKRYPEKLSNIQKEVLNGTIMGDECIYRFKTCNYATMMVSHAISQKEYAQLKFDIWRPFIPRNELWKRKRQKGTRVGFETGAHPEFETVRKEMYDNRTKRVLLSRLSNLTRISLAFWFQDDGSRCKNRGLAIHTNSFELDEVELISEWFENKWNIVAWPQRRKKAENGRKAQYVVFLSSKTSDDFAELIMPWILPSMRYKLAGLFTKNPQRLYANPFRYSDLMPDSNNTENGRHSLNCMATCRVSKGDALALQG